MTAIILVKTYIVQFQFIYGFYYVDVHAHGTLGLNFDKIIVEIISAKLKYMNVASKNIGLPDLRLGRFYPKSRTGKPICTIKHVS